MSWQVLSGDCLEVLPTLDAGSVQTCVTSPPYWGLRDYGTDGQLGLEPTPEEYVANLVSVFREVRRVLRDDGTVWLNLGDSYVSSPPGNKDTNSSGLHGAQSSEKYAKRLLEKDARATRPRPKGIKPKDLVGIPWRVAFALQADGWWLRSDIIWSKPNPMPESVTDRPTRAHEYVFLLSKSARYFYDADAIREGSDPLVDAHHLRYHAKGSGNAYHNKVGEAVGGNLGLRGNSNPPAGGRNRRSVWEVTIQPYSEAHFATFPPKLVEPCILAGSAEGNTVLDPFAGAGTTGLVAALHGRDFIGVELSPEYAEMARDRIRRWEANPNGLLDSVEVSADQLGLL